MSSPVNTSSTSQPAHDASTTSPKSHRFSIGSRLADKISRVTSTRGRKSVAITKTEPKRPDIIAPSTTSTMTDPKWLTNPRPAPKPPSGHGEGAATESARGPFLSSALDPPEVQKADLIAFQIEARHPQQATALRRAAQAARDADLAAEEAKASAVAAQAAAMAAEVAVKRVLQEVFNLNYLMRGYF